MRAKRKRTPQAILTIHRLTTLLTTCWLRGPLLATLLPSESSSSLPRISGLFCASTGLNFVFWCLCDAEPEYYQTSRWGDFSPSLHAPIARSMNRCEYWVGYYILTLSYPLLSLSLRAAEGTLDHYCKSWIDVIRIWYPNLYKIIIFSYLILRSKWGDCRPLLQLLHFLWIDVINPWAAQWWSCTRALWFAHK